MPEEQNNQNTVENKDVIPDVNNIQPETKTNEEKPVNNGEKIVERNEDGTLKKGSVLNPDGKPKGARHMTTLLKDAIVKVAEGSADSHDRLIVQQVIRKAELGDMEAVKHIWNYMEGKAPDTINLITDTIGLTEEQRAKLDFILGIRKKEEQEVVEPAPQDIKADDKSTSTPSSS